MSDQPPPTQEPILSDGEKLMKQWAQTRLAHEAVMLQDAQAVLRQARRTTANLPQQLETGNMTATGASEDEGVIHIGDVVQHLPQPVSPTIIPPVVSQGMSSLAKVALGFAVAGPIGAGLAAIPLVSSLLKPPAVVAPAETPKSDVPTVTIGGQEYQLELGEPDQQ